MSHWCYFEWDAPHLHRDGTVTYVRQTCSLQANHTVSHISSTKVTHERYAPEPTP